MEKFGAPFTVFVTTGMVTREIDAWWFGLASLVRSRDRVKLPRLNRTFDCLGEARKKRAFKSLESAIHDDFSILPQVREAIAASGIDCRALVDREALTEDQLRQLSRHPLVTIGGHTTTHTNLARAPASAVRWEIAENRTFIEGITGKPVKHFAYPFGHAKACGIREAQICRELGFQTASTTRLGALFRDHVHDLHALPRTHLAGDETQSTLRCKVDGFYRALYSSFGDPIARM
jgi:peptidoglycan/xylan/chitin deacetylase (PgdA/CDA1 family)